MPVPSYPTVRTVANATALVSACHSGDLATLGRSIVDEVATPVRAALVPGAPAALDAALGAGALGASVSGAGPALFAICRSTRSAERVGRAMQAAFEAAGLTAAILTSPADCPGARLA